MVSPFLQIDYGEPIFANKNKYAIMVFVDLPNVNIWLKLGIEPRSPGSHPHITDHYITNPQSSIQSPPFFVPDLFSKIHTIVKNSSQLGLKNS